MDNKVVLIILSILLPPLAVFFKKGMGTHFIINIVLLILTLGVGAIIHSLLLVFGVLK